MIGLTGYTYSQTKDMLFIFSVGIVKFVHFVHLVNNCVGLYVTKATNRQGIIQPY